MVDSIRTLTLPESISSRVKSALPKSKSFTKQLHLHHIPPRNTNMNLNHPFLTLLLALATNASFQDEIEIAPRGASPLACDLVISAIDFCASVSPGYVSLPRSRQAPCLCYSSTSWLPSIFDNAVQTCVNYAQTAYPVDFPTFSSLEGFCSKIGDVLPTSTLVTTTSVKGTGGAATPTAPLTTPKTTSKATFSPTAAIKNTASATDPFLTNTACAIVDYALSNCESATPGFATLSASQMAPCLCYSGTKWNPTGFDSPASTCAEYIKTADPSDYSLISPLASFCTRVGDVGRSGGGGSSTVSGSGSAKPGSISLCFNGVITMMHHLLFGWQI